MSKTPMLDLTVFLLRQSQLKEFEKEVVGVNQALALAPPLEGVVVPFSDAPDPPLWVAHVNSLLASPAVVDVSAQSPSALILVKRKKAAFVITFGHAWQKLRQAWVEPDFGRHVTLNLIKRNELVEIRSEQVFARWHLASERAPRPASVEEFGVEFDRDLVELVEGKPKKDTVFGKTIKGGTSLRIKIDISKLGPRFDRAFTEFKSDAYKKVWPEVDNLQAVYDESIRSVLDKELDALLLSKKAASAIVFFTPASHRGETITASSYVLGRMSSSPVYRPYLTLSAWRQLVDQKGSVLSAKEARATAVHIFDRDKNEIGEYSIYECVGCEIGLGGEQYVLSSGGWFKAAPDFVKKVNDIVQKIDQPTLALPPWNAVDSEGAYNRSTAASLKCLHFDEKFLLYGGGQSKFEFCDFMHQATKTLFFAKIASRSSGMSHLLEQVRRTSELLFALDGSYRRKLLKRILQSYPKVDVSWLDTRPLQQEWDLCFVSLGRKASELPFFAKCGLAKAVQDLRVRGHRVSFASV